MNINRVFLGYPNSSIKREIDRRYNGKFKVVLKTEPQTGGTTSGSGTYKYNQTITIKATPSVFFDFERWSDGSVESERNITITNDIQLTAFFKGQGGTVIFKPNY